MAFCSHCGKEMSDLASACPACGHPARAAEGAANTAPRNSGDAVAALVLGIAGMVVCPIVCSILAIVFGKKAQREIAMDPSLDGEGMASAGVILGWIGIALGLLGIVVAVWFISVAPHNTVHIFYP